MSDSGGLSLDAPTSTADAHPSGQHPGQSGPGGTRGVQGDPGRRRRAEHLPLVLDGRTGSRAAASDGPRWSGARSRASRWPGCDAQAGRKRVAWTPPGAGWSAACLQHRGAERRCAGTAVRVWAAVGGVLR